MRKYGDEMFKKYHAQINSAIQFQPEFDEYALVCLEALKYAFAICAAVLWAAAISFVVEMRAEIVKIFETVKATASDFLTKVVQWVGKMVKNVGVCVTRSIDGIQMYISLRVIKFISGL